MKSDSSSKLAHVLFSCLLLFSTTLYSQVFPEQGTYKGEFLFDDGRSQLWTLNLTQNQNFELTRSFTEQGQEVLREDGLGTWGWEEDQKILRLDLGREKPLVLQQGENQQLHWVDQDTPSRGGSLKKQATQEPLDLNDLMLSGMMTYFADSAVLKLCSTGAQYPILQEADYLALEQIYLEKRAAPAAPLYVMVAADLVHRPMMEGGPRQSVLVDEVLRVIETRTCEDDVMQKTLTETYWRIDSVGDVLVNTDESYRDEPHLLVTGKEPGSYAMTAGCNRMRGSVQIDQNSIKFGPSASTMMACPPGPAELEKSVSGVLPSVVNYSIEGNVLHLKDEHGKVVMALTGDRSKP